jgi:hypothetical protein
VQMILSPNAIFAAQIFLVEGASAKTKYSAMIEVQRGRGAAELQSFATPQAAMDWLRDRISQTGISGMSIESHP